MHKEGDDYLQLSVKKVNYFEGLDVDDKIILK